MASQLFQISEKLGTALHFQTMLAFGIEGAEELQCSNLIIESSLVQARHVESLLRECIHELSKIQGHEAPDLQEVQN
jgi:hypothetical protein